MCVFIDIHIHSFLLSSPKMKPMESPTAGPELVQASRTQQAFQIRQQLLQFGLLFWGAPMTLESPATHQFNCWCVCFFRNKPPLDGHEHGKRIINLGHKILKQAQVLFAPVFRTTKIAHPFTGIRIQAYQIGFRRKL